MTVSLISASLSWEVLWATLRALRLWSLYVNYGEEQDETTFLYVLPSAVLRPKSDFKAHTCVSYSDHRIRTENEAYTTSDS